MSGASESGPTPENILSFIRTPTPQLKATVGEQQATLPPQDFASMLGSIRGIFEKFTDCLQAAPAGAPRSAVLHELMERELLATASVAISCRKGCCGCCHYEVEVTSDEAEELRELVQGGVNVDRRHLEMQAARERKDPAWAAFMSPANRCAFLASDGTCRVYERRPSICRKHVVTTPPEACTTTGAQVAPVRVLLAEILLSAASSLDGVSHGPLAKMLLASLAANPAG